MEVYYKITNVGFRTIWVWVLNHVNGGRQGGAIKTPWHGGEMRSKIKSSIVFDSFDSFVGFLHGLALNIYHGMEKHANSVLEGMFSIWF